MTEVAIFSAPVSTARALRLLETVQLTASRMPGTGPARVTLVTDDWTRYAIEARRIHGRRRGLVARSDLRGQTTWVLGKACVWIAPDSGPRTLAHELAHCFLPQDAHGRRWLSLYVRSVLAAQRLRPERRRAFAERQALRWTQARRRETNDARQARALRYAESMLRAARDDRRTTR